MRRFHLTTECAEDQLRFHSMLKTQNKPSWSNRLWLLMAFALPGAYCAAIGGVALGAALFGPDRNDSNYNDAAWPLSVFLLPAIFLLLIGTRTTRQPLFLFVFIPLPVL